MFTLSPNNRDQPDQVLLDDLRAVAKKTAASRLTRNLYAEHGRFAAATVAKRFGGWGRAVEQAGLASPRHFGVTESEAVEDLQRVAGLLGAASVSQQQYRLHGRYSEKPYVKHFGNWVNALVAAGLEMSDHFNPRSTEESLFENLETVWQQLGRQPTVDDMRVPLSKYSAHTYKRRFGGWRSALEAFVAAASPAMQPEIAPQVVSPAALATTPGVGAERSNRTTRTVGWRLRYVVLCRDHFACRACGRSPATHPGVALQVDHVVPWSRGGETVQSNLQTLCEQCNGGKGAA